MFNTSDISITNGVLSPASEHIINIMLNPQYKSTFVSYDYIRIERNKQSFKYYISHSIPKFSLVFPLLFNRFISQQADWIQEIISNHLHNNREDTSYKFIIAIAIIVLISLRTV